MNMNTMTTLSAPVTHGEAGFLDQLADILARTGIRFVRKYHYYYVTDKRTLETKRRRYYSVEDPDGKWSYNRFQDGKKGPYYYGFSPGKNSPYIWFCLPMEVFELITL